MNKRFLYAKIVCAQIAALAVSIFITSTVFFNDSSITNANAMVVQDRDLVPTITVPTKQLIPTASPPLISPSPSPRLPSPMLTGSGIGGQAPLESQTVNLINVERENEGLGELSVNSQLSTAARRHAKDMCDHSHFDHVGTDGSTFSSRTANAGFSGTVYGEVIGWQQTSADSIFHGWMNSQGHHAIIMNSGINKIGVGWSGSCVVGVVGS